MNAYYILQTDDSAKTQTLSFIKEDGIWFADLPEFIEMGLGTKANLMMVDGADTFLDLLSINGKKVTLTLSRAAFNGYSGQIKKIRNGQNIDLLQEVGHAPVEYGAYYDVIEYNRKPFHHELWLCPVTEYIFNEYPDQIFFNPQKSKK